VTIVYNTSAYIMSLPTRQSNAEKAPPSPFTFDTIEDATEAMKNGEFVVVMDDESRENEGDLICAAEKVTTEGMAWMIRWTRSVSPLNTKIQLMSWYS
jgi:3,4-dihydroxy 2-butanone 4-phosphate synthase